MAEHAEDNAPKEHEKHSAEAADQKQSARRAGKSSVLYTNAASGRTREADMPWWKRPWDTSGSLRGASVRLSPEHMEMSRQLAILVNTHRLKYGTPDASEHTILDIVIHKRVTIAGLASAIARSPALCAGFEVADADKQTGAGQAIHSMGLEAATRHALALVLRRMVLGGRANSHPFAHELWEHSLAVAVAADAIAERLHFGLPILAYMTGLFHDIGMACLLKTLLALCDKQGMPAPDTDTACILCEPGHTEAGGFAARAWKLSGAVASVIDSHHRREFARDDRLSALRAIVELADLVAVRTGHGNEPLPDRAPLCETEPALFLKLSGERAAMALDDLPVRILNVDMCYEF